jgi:hypothetical protein
MIGSEGRRRAEDDGRFEKERQKYCLMLGSVDIVSTMNQGNDQ